MATSQRFSFADWKFGEWIGGNAEALKIVVAALFGLWVPVSPAMQIASGAALKLVLDLIHYWQSK